MGFFNWLSSAGNTLNSGWADLKVAAGKVYQPISKIMTGIKSASDWIDDKLKETADSGIPFLGEGAKLLRDNPIYSTIHGLIDEGDTIVNKYIPGAAGYIDKTTTNFFDNLSSFQQQYG